jgi:hypothetical protein
MPMQTDDKRALHVKDNPLVISKVAVHMFLHKGLSIEVML